MPRDGSKRSFIEMHKFAELFIGFEANETFSKGTRVEGGAESWSTFEEMDPDSCRASSLIIAGRRFLMSEVPL